MSKIGMIFGLLLLMASFSFASYSLGNVTFWYNDYCSAGGSSSNGCGFANASINGNGVVNTTTIYTGNAGNANVTLIPSTATGLNGTTATAISEAQGGGGFNAHTTATVTMGGKVVLQLKADTTNSGAACTVMANSTTLTSIAYNSTHTLINGTGVSRNCSDGVYTFAEFPIELFVQTGAGITVSVTRSYTGNAGGTALAQLNQTNFTATTDSDGTACGNMTYMSPRLDRYNSITLRTSGMTGCNNTHTTEGYCRTLLYFNNPLFGNTKLLSKIYYNPSKESIPSFYNSSDGSVYIANNTLAYILDSSSSVFYIVPPFICSNTSVIETTSTLQYDPSSNAITGGSVPVGVNLNGNCTYATASRLISCSGTDPSSTIVALHLSAYSLGNTTDLCAQTSTGSSGTLTCTLPNKNGTYAAYFYGTDLNSTSYFFAQKTIAIGSSKSFFGRDAYIAVLFLFGVTAMLLTSNIAISMILGCFGLFIGLAFGLLPTSDSFSVIAFTIIGLAIAYKLKV